MIELRFLHHFKLKYGWSNSMVDGCRYTYNIHKEMEERRKNPTDAQRRILDLLVEKRVEVVAEKRDQHPPR